MEELLKKAFYAGIGLTAIAAERVEATVRELIDKGKLSELDGKKIIEDFFKSTEHKKEEFEEKIKKATDEVVNKFSKSNAGHDIEHLVARIEAIEAKLGITAAPVAIEEAKEEVKEETVVTEA